MGRSEHTWAKNISKTKKARGQMYTSACKPHNVKSGKKVNENTGILHDIISLILENILKNFPW